MKNFYFVLFSIFSSTLFGQYVTPNDGLHWTLDSIAAHSPSTVMVINPNEYRILESIELSVTDSLFVNESSHITLVSDVLLNIFGYVEFNADNILIEAEDSGFPHLGWRLEQESTAYFNNTTFNYGGGIQCLTENFVMENCTVMFQSEGQATGAALTFSRGAPLVQNTYFGFNDLPAISSGANQEVQAQILNNALEFNCQSNENRPQINMGPSGEADSLRIHGNTIIGDPNITMAGGIASASLFGDINKVSIKNNVIQNNRYGVTVLGGNCSGIIANNIIENNNTQNEPNLGGSGISLNSSGSVTMNIIIANNQIRGNLWGITTLGTSFANLGDGTDLSPGGNVFSENGNGGIIYAFYNNTANDMEAQNNCWIEGVEATADQVEEVIVHENDISTLGFINYTPFNCSLSTLEVTNDENSIKIYPNPAKNRVFVNVQKSGNLAIFSSLGKKLKEFELESGKNELNLNLQIGVYFVQFKSGNKVYSEKLLIE